jgi:hypothetical protein
MKTKLFVAHILVLFVVVNLPAQINYSLSLNSADLRIVDTVINNQGYTTIQLADLQNDNKEGFPALPVKYLRFVIPLDMDFDNVIVSSSISEDSTILNLLLPGQSSIPLLGKVADVNFTEPDSIAYNLGMYPETIVEYISTDYFDEFNKIITIAVHPVVYHPLVNHLCRVTGSFA